MTYIWYKFLDYQNCCALLVGLQHLQEENQKCFCLTNMHIVSNVSRGLLGILLPTQQVV